MAAPSAVDEAPLDEALALASELSRRRFSGESEHTICTAIFADSPSDIHTRAELSERILDDATLRRLSTMEKKDAKRLSKVIKSEGKAEAAAVKGSIKELERLSKLQKEAAAAERKSQLRMSKHTSREHKARLRFLKEKERYEKIEGELRNAENDYEERRDHAAGLTAQVAEKTQELDDLRGQKAADDVSGSYCNASLSGRWLILARACGQTACAQEPGSLVGDKCADRMELHIIHVSLWPVLIQPVRRPSPVFEVWGVIVGWLRHGVQL